VVFTAGHQALDGNELVRVCDSREWIKQNRANPTENGGIPADTESQRENCYRRKSRRLCQHSQSVAHVLKQGIHSGSPSKLIQPRYHS
jgi:hypothetical protein